MQTVELPRSPSLSKPLGWPAGLAFSPDGRRLLVRCYKPHVLDTVGGEWWEPGEWSRADRYAAFARGGRAVAHLVRNDLAFTDPETGRSDKCALPGGLWRGLYASPGGESVYLLVNLLGGGPSLAEIWWYDANTFERRFAFARHKGIPNELVGSADGKWLATADRVTEGRPISIWDTADFDLPGAEAVTVVPKGELRGFALSADGSHLASATTRGVALWDAASGEEVFASGKHRRKVFSAAFNPTRPLLATGDADGGVFFWDFAGRVLTRYEWGLREVYALAFAPDGLRCAAADGSRVVIWDVDA